MKEIRKYADKVERYLTAQDLYDRDPSTTNRDRVKRLKSELRRETRAIIQDVQKLFT